MNKLNKKISQLAPFLALFILVTGCNLNGSKTETNKQVISSNISSTPETNVNNTNSVTIAISTPPKTLVPEKTPLNIKNSSPAATSTALITMTEFDKLENGMTYDAVAKIMKAPGKTQGALKTQNGTMQMYSWNGKNDKNDWNVTARFDNGKLINKIQFGLK